MVGEDVDAHSWYAVDDSDVTGDLEDVVPDLTPWGSGSMLGYEMLCCVLLCYRGEVFRFLSFFFFSFLFLFACSRLQ